MNAAVTLLDVLEARKAIASYLRPTPLLSYPALDRAIGARVFVKREDVQPIGSFKIRGGVNLLVHLSDQERRRGLITASTGNHGQSIARACALFGAHCVVVVPEGANPLKVRAMEDQRAEVVFHGEAYDEAREYAEELARRDGMRFVHPSDEPLLIAGVATLTLEILEEGPDLDVLLVPLGGGSGAAGACVVAAGLGGRTAVIAVQSDAAPAGYESWRAGHVVSRPNTTIAEGLATAQGYEVPQAILRELLDDFVLVSDQELRRAVYLYLDECRTLAEPAGAASLAGALKVRADLEGKKVGLVLSGANITLRQLEEVIEVIGNR
jgi:threonine dehydratase